VRKDIGALRTEQAALRGELAAQINGLETKMIRWCVGTALGCATLAFSIAKYVS
jgi:hypothetical protein